jgi:REP element-mobilizing transposase RayT
MPYDPNKHHRRSIRLKGYDYSQAGAYFVTMCAQHRELLFVTDDVIDMIQRWWDKLSEKFPGVETDAFVIMPNHAHGIIVIVGEHANTGEHVGSPQQSDDVGVNPRVDPIPRDDSGQTHGSAPTTNTVGVDLRVNPNPTLGEMIQWFKTMTTNEYIRGVKTLNWPPFPGKLWQRNYYEHIIRNEIELNAIRQYIIDNPARWEQDRDNPIKIRPAAETMAAYLSEAGL